MSGLYSVSRHRLVANENTDENYSTQKVEYITLDEIRRDGGTQPRAAINLQHVKLLEEQIEDGQQLEPVIVFYDEESYWLADGFHRWHAHRNREEEAIACVIHQGSRREAVLYSVGANADHKPALPRSREDKQRAVMTLLQDPEWNKWSDREIARRCKVHHNTVSKIRQYLTGDLSSNISSQSLTGDLSSEKRTYKTKHGTVAKMNTNNIGKKPLAPQEEQPDYNRVTVKDDHPLFPGQSGKITQLPNPDAAIVELDNGTRELIQLKDLDMEQQVSERVTIAHHLQLVESVLVEIHAPNNSKINGRLGRIAAVHESTVDVWVRDVNTMTMHRHTLKHQLLEAVHMDREPQLVEVGLRITRLRKCNLDPFEVEILLLLERQVAFTPVELKYLAQMEQDHGINGNKQ